MSSWAGRQQAKLPTKAVYTTYDSEDSHVINLNFVRNTTDYPDSDISVILKKTNDYNIAIVETITLNNTFSPYTLYINMNKFVIRNPSETIQLFQIMNRKVVIPSIKIPKTLIHTWNTKDIENTDLFYQVKVLKKINPDYNYLFFDENDRQKFIQENYDERTYKAYMKLKPPTYRTDLWRYCHLYKHGGIYMDFKFILRKSFNSILTESTKLLIGKAMYTDGINPGFVACLPNEPVMKEAIDTTVERIENNYYGVSSLDITGPLMFEHVFNKVYGMSSSEYIVKQNQEVVMGIYNDINNFNCILFNNTILAHNGFSTYYGKYRTSPYVEFWNNKNVYNLDS